MTECTKCGSQRISGPRYLPATYETKRDKLVYTCEQCGFQRYEPTLDDLMRNERQSDGPR